MVIEDRAAMFPKRSFSWRLVSLMSCFAHFLHSIRIGDTKNSILQALTKWESRERVSSFFPSR